MQQIQDKYGRQISYLRLGITDKCNMRCYYCMPEKNVKFLPRQELLSYEEMIRICRILKHLGIDKIRLTGGEPFMRKDLIHFIRQLVEFFPASQVHITTNGTFINPFLEELIKLGVSKINLSLDSLSRKNFESITRSAYFDQVMSCFHRMLNLGFQVKINSVVLQQKNTEDLVDLALLTEKFPIEVRFIEEMPFNGFGKDYEDWKWNANKIRSHLKKYLPGFSRLKESSDTAELYKIPDTPGKIGIIPSWTRSICGQCNRMRITPEGRLRTCLYDEGIFDLKNLIRHGATDEDVAQAICEAFLHKAKDGFEAQRGRMSNPEVTESMATIGG